MRRLWFCEHPSYAQWRHDEEPEFACDDDDCDVEGPDGHAAEPFPWCVVCDRPASVMGCGERIMFDPMMATWARFVAQGDGPAYIAETVAWMDGGPHPLTRDTVYFLISVDDAEK